QGAVRHLQPKRFPSDEHHLGNLSGLSPARRMLPLSRQRAPDRRRGEDLEKLCPVTPSIRHGGKGSGNPSTAPSMNPGACSTGSGAMTSICPPPDRLRWPI